MNGELFVYGTLQFSKIRDALLKREVRFKPSVANGYKAVKLLYGTESTEYPVLKKHEGSLASGLILSGLKQEDLDLLNFYEGSEYVLKRLPIEVNGEVKNIQCYMLRNVSSVEYGDVWDINVFKSKYLQEYIDNVIPETLQEYKSMKI